MRGKDGQPVTLKGSAHQKDIAAINAYAHKTIESSKNEGDTDNYAIIVEDFATGLSTMDGSSRHKANKKMMDLSYILDQMDQDDI